MASRPLFALLLICFAAAATAVTIRTMEDGNIAPSGAPAPTAAPTMPPQPTAVPPVTAQPITAQPSPHPPGPDFGRASLSVDVDDDMNFLLKVNSQNWLKSGDIRVQVDGKMHSVSDKTLKLDSTSAYTGTDAWGSYTAKSATWDASGTPYKTTVRTYPASNAVVFAQSFPRGATGTSVGDVQSVVSSFPAIAIADPVVDDTETSSPPQLGYLEYYGTFIDDSANGPHIGQWHGGAAPSNPPGGLKGGPFVWFNADNGTVSAPEDTPSLHTSSPIPPPHSAAPGPTAMPPQSAVTGPTAAPIPTPAPGPVVRSKRAAVVLSPASHFMSASHTVEDGEVRFGVMGGVTSLPLGWSQEWVAYADDGVTSTMQGWGDLLLNRYGKNRHGPEFDFTVTNLGYNTDHGAFYYYQTEAGKDYLGTLVDVFDDAMAHGVPYKHALLDSWWYYKGPNDGVLNWTAMPSIFPHGNAGIQELHETTGWPFIGHNRWWSKNTTYAKQNGGKWDFIVEDKMAIPLQGEFWDYLLSDSAKWGLKVYEQDWLYNEFEGLNATLQDVTLGRQWLTQMGDAAARAGLTVQYCMPYPRHALQSVEIPAVTQIRNSDDYVPGQSNIQGGPSESDRQRRKRANDVRKEQWKIGMSSLFAHALALAPFKDNFWSTSVQPGNPYGANKTEPVPALQAAVSTYSAGPVTPSDAVGLANVELIMRSCRQDGRLLRPDRPAVSLDASYQRIAFGAMMPGPDGEVWQTLSTVGKLQWAHVLVAELQSDYLMPLDQLPDTGIAMTPFISYRVNGTTLQHDRDSFTTHVSADPFTPYVPLVAAPLEHDFYLIHFAPMLGNTGWALIGDETKWVPVSKQRFVDVATEDKDVHVTVQGSPGEVVPITFVHVVGASHVPTVVTCVIGEGGRMVASVPEGSCLPA